MEGIQGVQDRGQYFNILSEDSLLVSCRQRHSRVLFIDEDVVGVVHFIAIFLSLSLSRVYVLNFLFRSV